MSGMVSSSYQGWDITICCLEHGEPISTASHASRYTASGHVVLQADIEDGGGWVDARPQTVTLGNRLFDTKETCREVLLAEIKVLIDALKKDALY